MSTDTTTPPLNGQCTGIRRELGRYTAEGIDRILFGQRVDRNAIRLIDTPAVPARGCLTFAIEVLDATEGYGAVQALVADYLQQARRTHQIPAAACADNWFDDLADSFRYDRQRAAALKADAAADATLEASVGAIA